MAAVSPQWNAPIPPSRSSMASTANTHPWNPPRPAYPFVCPQLTQYFLTFDIQYYFLVSTPLLFLWLLCHLQLDHRQHEDSISILYIASHDNNRYNALSTLSELMSKKDESKGVHQCIMFQYNSPFLFPFPFSFCVILAPSTCPISFLSSTLFL